MDNEAYIYQKKFNKGQAQINYQLVEVNEKLIESINGLVAILTALRDDRPTPPQLRQMNLGPVVAAIQEATEINNTVAGIDPPGCEPYPN